MLSAIIPFYGTETETLFITVKNIHESPLIEEILIVNDGSSLEAELQGLAALLKKIRVISHSSNCGASAARNTGAGQAKADYLLFIDSDVVLNEGSLVHAALTMKEKNLRAVQGVYELHTPGLNAVSEYKHYWQMINILAIPEGPTSIVGTALFIIERELFNQIGGFKKLGTTRASVEDRIFGIQMAKTGVENYLLPGFKGEHRHRFTLKSFLRTQFLRAMDEILYRKEIAHNKSYHSSKKIYVLALMILAIPSVVLDLFFLFQVSGKFRLSWIWISLMNSVAITFGVAAGFLKSL